MSVPNFSFLACLEVAEKFVWCGVGGVDHLATVSNLNPSYLELLSVELSWVESSWVRVGFWQYLKNSTWYWDLKVLRWRDFVLPWPTKISVTRSIFELQGSSLGFCPLFICSLKGLSAENFYWLKICPFPPWSRGHRWKIWELTIKNRKMHVNFTGQKLSGNDFWEPNSCLVMIFESQIHVR